MTGDSCPKAPEEPAAGAAAAARQRKKRKWDQPAESLISGGLAVPGAIPLGIGTLAGVGVPGITPLSGSILVNPVAASCTTAPHLHLVPALQQNTATIIQKLNQPKIQDELIAREIVINDAEATVRCKLTKRQTQEEIQKCTGAVVITRGKYRPPNALPDNEKPLYLHISSGSHLKDTAERIKAVDCAASMVEEILKQGQSSQVLQPLTTCVYLGFDPDPSLNIVARIRGPNDQYMNHIMNETGVTVMLRGRGSGNVEIPHAAAAQEPLHLYLSSNNPKSLEDARILAENLVDTISLECGASRVSECKVYKAVPPPQQLLDGVENSGNVTGSLVSVSTCSSIDPTMAKPCATSAPVSSCFNIRPPGSLLQHSGLVNYGHQQANGVSYPHLTIARGTSYSGYGGIYPQATPLQQVALALRQAPASTASITATTAVPPTAVSTSTVAKMTSSSGAETEKRPQRRKFQELQVAPNGPPTFNQNLQQGSGPLKPGVSPDDLPLRNASSIPPLKLVQLQSNGMLPPPQKSMAPSPPQKRKLPLPPPPPKFTSQSFKKKEHENEAPTSPSAEHVPDTLMKLMEYGDEDDDADGYSDVYSKSNSTPKAPAKPFWAV